MESSNLNERIVMFWLRFAIALFLIFFAATINAQETNDLEQNIELIQQELESDNFDFDTYLENVLELSRRRKFSVFSFFLIGGGRRAFSGNDGFLTRCLL